MFRRLKSFFRDSAGNVAILTAFTLPLIMVMIGGAIEYGFVYHQKQKLKAAADSAALAAVNEAHAAYTNQDDVDLQELISSFAMGAFDSAVAKETLIQAPQLEVTSSVNNNVFSVTVDYDAQYRTLLAGLVGRDTFIVGGSSSATTTAASYMNINLVFDVSHSMAIGASTADQRLMGDVINCAFACHIGGGNNTSYRRAQRAGATMRIDVARNAAMSAIDVVERSLLLPEQASFSVYKFDNLFHEVVPVSDPNATDLRYVTGAINSSIHLTEFYGGTNIEWALQQLHARIPAGGSGATPDDRLQYLIVLTDGVESTQARLPTGGWVQHSGAQINSPSRRHAHHEVNYALNADVCDHFNQNNVQVYFIYTEYDNPPFGHLRAHDQRRFGFIESTLHDLIPERFETCTQIEERVLEASTPREIEETFTELLGTISSPLRLN